MKPQHQLMLRKVGKGVMFSKLKPVRTHEMKPEEQPIRKITEDMGMGLKVKRKPLKFKL